MSEEDGERSWEAEKRRKSCGTDEWRRVESRKELDSGSEKERDSGKKEEIKMVGSIEAAMINRFFFQTKR